MNHNHPEIENTMAQNPHAENTSEHHKHTHGYISHKPDYMRRLNRIEGQVRGIQRMVENDEYCIDILTQMSAITKALQAVALGLVRDHINTCVLESAEAGEDELNTKLNEIMLTLSRLMK